jgi:hypothetical protein
MNVQVGRNQGGLGVGIARLALVAANDRGNVPVVDGDSRILDEFVAAQEPACRNYAGHPVVPFLSTGKDIAREKCPEMSLAAKGDPLAASSRTEATGANGQ